MTLLCDFELNGDKIVCQRCGIVRPARWTDQGELEPRFRACDLQGLGTWLGRNLDRLGITKERYNEVMSKLRLVETKEIGCKACLQRQNKLDRLTPKWVAKLFFKRGK